MSYIKIKTIHMCKNIIQALPVSKLFDNGVPERFLVSFEKNTHLDMTHIVMKNYLACKELVNT